MMFKKTTKRKPNKRIDILHLDIPAKANRILHLILIGMLLILFRVWHLSVIQYDQKLEESQKPQRKTLVEPSVRATIRDRFNLPLAINKISYQATILYSQLRDIPSFEWKKDEEGKRIKVFKRKLYIRELSEKLGEELNMDADRIEDLIHSKASYYSQVPFVLKTDLSEKEYYRLKMMEKDWPGIHMRSLPKRYYPRGKVAADVVGYMGAINRPEYEKILHEIKVLVQFISNRENDIETEPPRGIDTLEQARKRLRDLEERAYSINDYVGKTGIEGTFEEQLRGFYGKKIFDSDSKGNFLRELPGSRAPLSGQRILLTLSAELQEYAEKLLAENEKLRPVRKSKLAVPKKTVLGKKEPWIKGGAIVVMEPFTGEILTLASYPRFDPNDFISGGDAEQRKEKINQINRWFENEGYLSQLWDLQQPLKRERVDSKEANFFEESSWITWKNFLNFILSEEGAAYVSMLQLTSIIQAVHLQEQVELLLSLFPDYDLYTIFNCIYTEEECEPYRQTLKAAEKQLFYTQMNANQSLVRQIKSKLSSYFGSTKHVYDRVLITDLCRLAVNHHLFSPDLLIAKGNETLENYHTLTGSLVTLTKFVKEQTKELFHDIDFKNWREREEKNFLKTKREEEKIKKSYPKPYLDYLDQQESSLFKEFWNRYQWDLLLAFLTGKDTSDSDEILRPYAAYFINWYIELQQGAHQSLKWKPSYDQLQNAIQTLPSRLIIEYLQSMRPYNELNRPLFGRYRYLRSENGKQLEKHLAVSFYTLYGYGYGRSHAYRQAAIQGSLFKLVTAYEALVQKFKKMGNRIETWHDLNPLIITDEGYQHGSVRYVGYTAEGKPIPQLYKGGRLPRSLARQHIGKIDLIRALEVSSNPYFSLLAGECLDKPEDLSDAASLFSFGNKTGIDLPAEISGKVPKDLSTNRTGLYATAIGQHSLVVTPLQTAVMLAALANGGKILKPKIVLLTAGRQLSDRENQIICTPSFPYKDTLGLVGIDFPLFSSKNENKQESLVNHIPTIIKNTVFLPEMIRQILFKGLQAAGKRTHEDSLASLTKLYRSHPSAIRDYNELKSQLFGKTSTSESVENIDLDLEEGTNIYTHVWFGSIVLENSDQNKNKTILLLKDEFGRPELIVVVYLRYGGYGKEAAPLAAQIAKKWREIKKKYEEMK